MTNETRQCIVSIGAFILPLALMKAASILSGGPSAVRADAGPLPVEVVPATRSLAFSPMVHLTDAQRAALAHATSLDAQPLGASPLYYDPDAGSRSTSDPVASDGLPHMTLQAVMSSPDGGAALIDGAWVRIGDSIGQSGWIVESIDARARTVIANDPRSNRTMALSVDADRGS